MNAPDRSIEKKLPAPEVLHADTDGVFRLRSAGASFRSGRQVEKVSSGVAKARILARRYQIGASALSKENTPNLNGTR